MSISQTGHTRLLSPSGRGVTIGWWPAPAEVRPYFPPGYRVFQQGSGEYRISNVFATASLVTHP